MTEIPEDRVDHNDVARCELCGEAMPPGEGMFKFHGYSGPCPKPPLPKPTSTREFYVETQQAGPVTLQFASVKDNGKNIARFPNTEEGRANAKLLASAPKLLEACRKALAAFASANELGKSTWSGVDVDDMRVAVASCQ